MEPRRLAVKARLGCTVRAGPGLDSEELGNLALGTSVVVVEETTASGRQRLKLGQPLEGWISARCVGPAPAPVVDEAPQELSAIAEVHEAARARRDEAPTPPVAELPPRPAAPLSGSAESGP